MKKQYYNLLMEFENNIFTLTDVRNGKTKSWRIKTDIFCGYCYQIQKTQIKTMYEDMNELLKLFTNSDFNHWMHHFDFYIDFKYIPEVV